MQKLYSVVQQIGTVLMAGLLIGALVLWVGVPAAVVRHATSLGLGLAGLFAILSIVLGVALRVRGTLPTPAALSWLYERLSVAAFGIFVLHMVAGLIAYPYAPVTERDGEYRDKLGRTQTAAQYRLFQVWEAAISLSGAAVIVSGFGALSIRLAQRS